MTVAARSIKAVRRLRARLATAATKDLGGALGASFRYDRQRHLAGRQWVLPSADARGGGSRLHRVLGCLSFLPRETFSFLRLLVGAAPGRLWCCNVEDAEEVTADNVSLISEVVLLKFKLDLSRFFASQAPKQAALGQPLFASRSVPLTYAAAA